MSILLIAEKMKGRSNMNTALKYETQYEENLERGIELFNEGRFFEAHEAWEILWLNAEEPEDKQFLQGLIMAAGAFIHYAKRECAGSGDAPGKKQKGAGKRIEHPPGNPALRFYASPWRASRNLQSLFIRRPVGPSAEDRHVRQALRSAACVLVSSSCLTAKPISGGLFH